MMTDYKAMKSLFNKLGIKYEEFKKNDGGLVIHLAEGEGYYGFYCEFSFDKHGKFLSHGVWE